MTRYALTNTHILNGHIDMEPTTGMAIIVADGKFEKIIPENELPQDIEKVDLKGGYILPGLINLHVHIPSSGRPSKKRTDYNKIAALLKYGTFRAIVKGMCASYARQQLLSGTTTIRAVGGVLDFDTWLRDKINAGEKQGPRILAANYAISVPGGHMTGSVALPAHSVEEAVKMVEDLDKTHPDHIKLMITGGVLDCEVPGEPGILKMPPEYVKAACDKAHELGYMVAAHVESTQGMIVALENGVDTIEHGGKPTDETTELFKKRNAALVCTLSPAVPFTAPEDMLKEIMGGMGDMYIMNGQALVKNIIECAKRCLDEGITVGLGTDTGCPYTTHYDMWRELYYFVKYCNVTPAYALYTATCVNASIAKISDITGTIDEGKSADFMVVAKNPLEDLTALRNPMMVSLAGNIINEPKIKKIAEVEKQLDRLL